MEKQIERFLHKELKGINPKIFADKRIVEESVFHLLRVREELDEFIDTLEMLSDENFRKNLEKGLKQYKKGETISTTLDNLRKQLKDE
ncbi:MAG: hypothetical protein DRP10_03450 [Candidatus Aenigmatarchaeota archaeon]|nr:MAG: hypothetical protein DRP10_03450 [Candidatus Aenigmarchaeota archaeon]